MPAHARNLPDDSFAVLRQSVYETFNFRQIRRQLCDLLSATALVVRMIKSLPHRRELQLLAAKSFLHFLRRRVDRMRQLLQIFSGHGLRQDGHLKLPKRVVSWKLCTFPCKNTCQRLFLVVFSFCSSGKPHVTRPMFAKPFFAPGKDGKRRLRGGEFKCLFAMTGVDGALRLPPV